MSDTPSPLKSATAAPWGAGPVVSVVLSANPPAPSPLQIWIELEVLLTTARSALPSRLKSAAITCFG